MDDTHAEDEKRKKDGTWKKGVSGNPGGRPKDGHSWSEIVKEVGNMYAQDLLAIIDSDTTLGKILLKLPHNVQMKYLVTARVFASLMLEPTSGLWNGLMDRAEGKVAQEVILEKGKTISIEMKEE